MSELYACLEMGTVEASAPCRIDMGGTLDLSTFYLPLRHMKPCTFNAALDLRTRVSLEPYTAAKLKVSSRGFDSFEVDSAAAPFRHPLGLILAVAAYFNAQGVHIRIDSASPPRSALGGSSVAAVALIWAFCKALARAGHPMPEPEHVALLAQAIEQSVAGVPCGIQDQLAAVYGGVNAWTWPAAPGSPAFMRREIVPAAGCADFSKHLLVAYCGAPHVSQDINGTWVREFLAGRNRAIWRQIAAQCHAFIDALSVADYPLACNLMNAETDLRLHMTPDVLDSVGKQLVDAARKHGCGARFSGAGGGGCVWALGNPEEIGTLRTVWQGLVVVHPQAAILQTAVDATGIL